MTALLMAFRRDQASLDITLQVTSIKLEQASENQLDDQMKGENSRAVMLVEPQKRRMPNATTSEVQSSTLFALNTIYSLRFFCILALLIISTTTSPNTKLW